MEQYTAECGGQFRLTRKSERGWWNCTVREAYQPEQRFSLRFATPEDDTLTQDGAWCQCNGCLEMYSTEEVWRTVGFKGQNGCGSLYDSRV